jgi:hypothetical protein
MRDLSPAPLSRIVSSLVMVMAPVEPTVPSYQETPYDSGVSPGTIRTEVGCGLFELNIKLIGKHSATGEDSKVTKDRLAVITKPRSFHSGDLQLATKFVEDASSESLAVDIFGDDNQRTTLLSGRLERGKDVLKQRDLLLGQKDKRLLIFDLLRLDVRDKVGSGTSTWVRRHRLYFGRQANVYARNVAAVEAHALGDLNLVLDRLALLDGDDTFLADLKRELSKSVRRKGSEANMSTFSMAVAMSWPTCLSPFAEMVATCAISADVVMERLLVSRNLITWLRKNINEQILQKIETVGGQTHSTAAWLPRRRSMGLQPAATFLTPKRSTGYMRSHLRDGTMGYIPSA